jgi:cysteine desulfurase
MDDLGVDLLSISAHKIYGPKGAGALFARADTIDLPPLVRGGSQERRRRGGTENVAGIVGLATALDLAAERRAEYRNHLRNLRSRLIERLAPVLDDGAILNSPGDGAPHLVNISFPSVNGVAMDGEMLLLNLDVAGIAVSSGSACTSGAVEPSHVLLAMGRDRETAAATVRFSLGRENTAEGVDYAADQLLEVVRRMRDRGVRK